MDEQKLNPWEKVVVTMEGIDDWRAQLYGADIKNFPKVRPDNMPVDLYTELKKKYIVRTKINKAKKDHDEAEEGKNRVQSRYMEWH